MTEAESENGTPRIPLEEKNRPFSGRIVAIVQQRYTEKKLELGLASEYSCSEQVLYPLKTKGLIGGFTKAFSQAEEMFIPDVHGWKRKLGTSIGLFIGGTEFFLITLGIKPRNINGDGHWEPFTKFVERIDPEV